ncbi:MAG: hypothetical protein AAFQ52_17200, partial [Chloroflexota bacterium]
MLNQNGLLALIVISCGLIFAPTLIYAVGLMRGEIDTITLFMLSLFASVLFLPTFIAFAIRPQRGTAT